MSTSEHEQRRLTPTERLHDVARMLAERTPSAASKPHFNVSRTKAGAEQAKSGVFEFYEFEAHVPVCDEFPTADEAFAALIRYKRSFAEEVGA